MSSVHPAGAMEPPKIRQFKGQIPSLDGLRAISILLVIAGHLSGTRGFGRLQLGIGDYAHLGVVVFFVISGFLITNLLLAEHEKNGRVSLKLFYARRSIRIFPASFAFIGVVGVLTWSSGLQVHARDFWHALTYTVNFQPGASWQTGHLWSLSVEEQFYLLWPFTFVLLGTRKAFLAAGAVILLGPTARFLAWLLLRGTGYEDLNMFPMVADSLATGCLLARLQYWLAERRWYQFLFHPIVSLGLFALVLITNRFMGYTVVHVFGTSLINLCLAVLIHRSTSRVHDPLGRFLNWRPFAGIGVLSYSLYLWQQLFLNRASADWMNAFPQNLLLAFVFSLASYLLLEKPLLQLRRRLRS